MQKYEIMAIIANKLDEKAAAAHATEGIVGKIKELEGKTSFEDFWGSRGFAYKIKGETWGYYFVAQFDMDRSKVVDLKNELNLDTNIVRFMTTKVDPRSGEPRKYADMKAEYDAQEKKAASEKAAKAEAKAAPAKSAGETAPKKEKLTTVVEKPASKEASKDAVDKKLDDIISESTGDL